MGNSISLDQFYSIESNPTVYGLACEHLAERSFQPHLLCGICLPRTQIAASSGELAPGYTNPVPLDDLMGYVLRAFERFARPGPAGCSEPHGIGRTFLRPFADPPRCYVVLKNLPSVHCPCLTLLQNDPRFQVLELSRERLGFCIAQFDPA